MRKLSFAIVNSSTIALPAWKQACRDHHLPERLIPRDVKTRWNSTYDMVCVAIKYREAIDDVTGNKLLKLRKHELEDEHWIVLKDLVRVLKVSTWFLYTAFHADAVSSCSKMQPYSSPPTTSRRLLTSFQ